MNPWFSILVPVYNQMGKTDRCVESLKRQTCADFEAILVDDGSTDGSGEALDALAAADPRFHAVHHDRNRSLVAARLTAMQRAAGRYILFVDSDDWVEPDLLSALQAAITEKPVDVLRFGFVYEPKGNVSMPCETEDPLRAMLLGREAPAIWKRCYSADLVRKAAAEITPFYCNMAEDTFYSVMLLSRAETWTNVPKTLYHYDDGGISSQNGSGQTPAQLRRRLDSVYACGEHLRPWVRRERPEILPQLEKCLRFGRRYTASTAISFESDLVKVVEHLRALDTSETRDLYEWGCRQLLPYRFSRDLARQEKLPFEEQKIFWDLLWAD